MAVNPKDRVYKLELVRDRDMWIATLPEVQGCHTYGETLDEARKRIRDAFEISLTDHTPEQAAVIAAQVHFNEHIVYNQGKGR
jgi:predicted RNase H-like HicB family nuclease